MNIKILRWIGRLFSKTSVNKLGIVTKLKMKNLETSFVGRAPLIKSEYDKMEYRLLELKNGIRVMLVSDVQNIIQLESAPDPNAEESEEEEETGSSNENDTDMEIEYPDTELPAQGAEEKLAACALCVAVGSFSDPSDIPGLAHFLEHMVFMGSEKHPKENGFDDFITRHGGSDNAVTDCEFTNFYFEIHEQHLKEAMDRFAQFFVSPLMKKEAITRERESIHSEFEMSLPSDSSRAEQILGSLAPAGHPAGKFFWGNLKTLKDEVEDEYLYQRVHEFRLRHYSAHRMTVAVQARLPLDTLEEYVTAFFSSIPSNGAAGDSFDNFKGMFGTADNFHKVIHVESVKDVCKLHLTWVLPSYVKEYRSRPIDYVGWLVSHEGEGSLTSYLRNRVLILTCTAGNSEDGFEHNSMYDLFTITFTLSEAGMQSIDQVVSAVFSYLAMLRTHIPDPNVYHELERIHAINYKYKREQGSCENVETLAESMHQYDPEHYLAGGELYMEYRPDLITAVLEGLQPSNVNIMVQSRGQSQQSYDKVEPWFNTRYTVQDVAESWRTNWETCEALPCFHLPSPNRFLPSDFSLLDAPAVVLPYPALILDTDLLQVWHRQDSKFSRPIVHCFFYIVSSKQRASARSAALLDLLVAFFKTKFTEQIYPATLAGLNCGYLPCEWGLMMQYGGYHEKLPHLVEEVLCLVRSFYQPEPGRDDNIDLSLFDAIKKQQLRDYYNLALKPSHLVKSTRLCLLIDSCWTSLERREALENVNLEDLRRFAADLFQECRIKSLVQGNISAPKAISVVENVQKILLCKPAKLPSKKYYITKLPVGQRICHMKSLNLTDANSVLTNYYQGEERTFRDSCIIGLLMLMMEEPLFDTLRTKQQVGYSVACELRDTFGVLGFTVSVHYQASKFSPLEVDSRVEQFLKSFSNTLTNMPSEEVEQYKKALCEIKSAADLQLLDEVGRNFSEISSFEYTFDRLQRELAIVPSLTKEDVCDWYQKHMAGGPEYKKLSIQAVGSSLPRPDCENSILQPSNSVEGEILKLDLIHNPSLPDYINNIQEFRSTSTFISFEDQLP